MKTRSTLFRAAAFALTLILSSCGMFGEKEEEVQTEEAVTIDSTQVLRLNLFTEPPVLDPRQCNDSTSFHVVKMLFEGLTRIHPNGEPLPALAKDIEISEDLKTYRFLLRDALWSNGDPVTAEDFAFAWKSILDPEMPTPYAYQLYVIRNAEKAKAGFVSLDEVGIRVIDEKTLEVELENPTPYFLELTAFVTYFPVNKGVAMRNPGWYESAGPDYVSNGPFVMSSWEHNESIEVLRNTDYWDKDQVRLQKIEMVMVDDENTELAMFENGELDWAGRPMSRLPSTAIPSLKEQGLLRKQPIAGAEWYKFNTGRFPFNHEKIRKAFSLAINRSEIVENLLPGENMAALGLIPQPLAVNQEALIQDGQVEEARRLFHEALEEMGLDSRDLPPLSL